MQFFVLNVKPLFAHNVIDQQVKFIVNCAMKNYQSTKQTVSEKWKRLIKNSKICHDVESCLAVSHIGKIAESYMITSRLMIRLIPALIVVIVILMILGIIYITTTLISISKKPVSHETINLDRAVESYVNACWITKTSKNLINCKIQIADIENQCKTNINYSQVIACQDPRIAQLVNEQGQSFNSSQ
jgi:hypothetical protein